MDKKALITGAASGLGRQMLIWLINRGWCVLAIDRDAVALEHLVSTYGSKVQPHCCDLSDDDNFHSLIEELTATDTKPFDFIALNAGISATGKFEQIDPSSHLRLLTVNAHTPLILTNALLAFDKLNQGAKILFVSSLSHAVGYPGAASYAASKDVIASYGVSLRKKRRKHKIGVSVAFPGPLRTDHAQRHAPEGADESKRMAPDKAADKILRAVEKGTPNICPGFSTYCAYRAGKLAPKTMARFMRRIIYDKLDKLVAD